jgi:transcriptional regulator with XRE-family HTH domain
METLLFDISNENAVSRILFSRSSMATSAAATALSIHEPPKVGATLQALRQGQGLSLDELSRRAGVSKSMLSQIERNLANPTVAVVWRLANALRVELAELLGGERVSTPVIETVAAHSTPSMSSPDGLCQLRILGPIDLAGQFEWYQLTIQPGGALESAAHEPGAREHLSVLSGSLEVSAAGSSQRLVAGETARYAADGPHAIRHLAATDGSATPQAAVALLVVLHP